MKLNRSILFAAFASLLFGSNYLMGQPRMGKGGMGQSGMKGMTQNLEAPSDNPITPEKVELGKQLYFDGRLSKDLTISCNSCHNSNLGGTDNKQFSTGVAGALGVRNAPTVWNAGFHGVQFWDGRAKSLEEQAKGPLVNPVEMAMPNYDAVAERIQKIPGYVSQFDRVFGKKSVNIENIVKAIATYERTLISRNSKFDNFRFVDKGALNDEEFEGFRTFRQVGCTECHRGPDFAGPPMLSRGEGFFQKMVRFPNDLLVKKYKLLEDNGRFDVTKQESDRNVFRVPSLRNVEKTAPYFHNGSVATLSETVRTCAKLANNRDLNDGETKALVAFLDTLTGEVPEQKPPKLP